MFLGLFLHSFHRALQGIDSRPEDSLWGLEGKRALMVVGFGSWGSEGMFMGFPTNPPLYYPPYFPLVKQIALILRRTWEGGRGGGGGGGGGSIEGGSSPDT